MTAAPPVSDPHRQHYHPKRRDTGGLKIVAGAILLLLIGGGAAAFFLMRKQEVDQAQVERNNSPPAPDSKTESKETEVKSTGRTKGKNPKPAPDLAPKGVLARTLTPIAIAPFDPGRQGIDPVDHIVRMGQSFDPVRRIFLPVEATADFGFVALVSAGFQGSAEKYVFNRFRPSGQARTTFEFDGNGKGEPICDCLLKPEQETFALAVKSKVTIWKLTEPQVKVIDGFEPFADLPAHRESGVAAVYLTSPPTRFVTVSGLGGVRVWEMDGRKNVGEFIPPKLATTQPIDGKSVAISSGRGSMVLVVGGVIYEILLVGKVGGESIADLGGSTAPLALATAGYQSGVVFACQGSEPKKEKAVIVINAKKEAKAFHWPDAFGDPLVAAWADESLVGITATAGKALWLGLDEDKAMPRVVVETPVRSILLPYNGHLWLLTRDAEDPKACTLVSMPQPAVEVDFEGTGKRPIPTLRADLKGMSK